MLFSSTIKLNVSNEMRIYKHVYDITNSIETIPFIYVLYTPIYAKYIHCSGTSCDGLNIQL